MKSILSIIILLSFLLSSGCNASKEKYETELVYLNNKISEQERGIEELKEIIRTLNEEIKTLKSIGQSTTAEDDINSFKIPESYEEALELMNKLQIENVVLERILINNEIRTVVEIKETVLTVAGDGLLEAYDIPDISGNVIFLVANPPPKLDIYVTGIAIIEEPYIARNGNKDHWVKIRMEDGKIGWIKGEYTGLNRGGIKFLTKRNIWFEENYAQYGR